MPRKCPPGVICLENMTLVVIGILVSIILYVIVHFMYKRSQAASQSGSQTSTVNKTHNMYAQPTYSFSNIPNDLLFNPYTPPRKTNPFFPTGPVQGGVPINQNPSGFQSSYTSIGILTRVGGPTLILPLMGRPLHKNGDKWQYYTFSENNSFVKLPVNVNGKNCAGDYGCKEIYNGDTVYVQGYNDIFKVTVYENSSPQYIPYL
jgi:hypothetical protein